MLAYTIKRFLYVLPVALGVSLVCFLLVHITPGDPLTAVLPVDATAETQAQMRALYGFDKPLPVQYGLWIWRVLQGDLGASIATGRPVATEVMNAVRNSIILASAATCIGFALGALLGIVAGYFRGGWIDRAASLISVLGVSVPH
jgi:peptide/nickel transport system permease protein